MAVQEQTPIIEYIANGSTNIFPITFDIHSTEDLGVLINGELALEASYQVQDNSVVFMVIPPSGSAVTLFRDTEKNRLTDYKSYDNSFRPSAINWDLDKLWHVLQEQNLVDAKILARLKQEIEWRRTHDFNYDELAQVREKQLFDALKGYTDTLLASTNPGVFQGVIAGVVFARDGKSIQTHIEEILNNIELNRSYIDEQVGLMAPQATTYNKVEVDTKINAEARRAQVAEQVLQDQVNAVGVGNKAYKTYALMDADKTNIPAESKVTVTNDATASNNGDWQWDGVAFTKSAYDPVEQSINNFEEKVSLEPSKNKIFSITDSKKRAVFFIDIRGRLWIKNLKNDLVSSINKILESLEKITGTTALEFSDKNILSVVDKLNRTVLKLTKTGDLYIPKIGNLNNLLEKYGYYISCNKNDGNALSTYKAAKYTDVILANIESKQSFFNQVFITKEMIETSGLLSHSVRMIRIPAVTRIAVDKYLVFFEAREDGEDLGKNSQLVCTIQINSENGEITTSNIQLIDEAYLDEENQIWTFMNACAVRMHDGKIICLYVKRGGVRNHSILKIVSTDSGETWSAPEDIGNNFNMSAYNLLCPCSAGIVKKYGKNKGRIIFPVWISGVSYNVSGFRSGYIYSDDSGETWSAGDFVDIPTSNEVQCAEDLSGDIYFLLRIENEIPQPKLLVRLDDRTGKFDYDVTSERFTEQTIMSSIIQADNSFDKSTAKLHVASAGLGRRNLKVYTSYDSGKNWEQYLVPGTDSFAAYVCLDRLNEDQIISISEASAYTSFRCDIINTKQLAGI